jgi:hypothetical protein
LGVFEERDNNGVCTAVSRGIARVFHTTSRVDQNRNRTRHTIVIGVSAQLTKRSIKFSTTHLWWLLRADAFEQPCQLTKRSIEYRTTHTCGCSWSRGVRAGCRDRRDASAPGARRAAHVRRNGSSANARVIGPRIAERSRDESRGPAHPHAVVRCTHLIPAATTRAALRPLKRPLALGDGCFETGVDS